MIIPLGAIAFREAPQGVTIVIPEPTESGLGKFKAALPLTENGTPAFTPTIGIVMMPCHTPPHCHDVVNSGLGELTVFPNRGAIPVSGVNMTGDVWD